LNTIVHELPPALAGGLECAMIKQWALAQLDKQTNYWYKAHPPIGISFFLHLKV
jgi:hypothetical protein